MAASQGVGANTLTVTDNRTGKQYEIPIHEGDVILHSRVEDLVIRILKDDSDLAGKQAPLGGYSGVEPGYTHLARWNRQNAAQAKKKCRLARPIWTDKADRFSLAYL